MSFEIGKTLRGEIGRPLGYFEHGSFLLQIKDIVASRTYIASETRHGKSHTTRLIVEKTCSIVPVIIIDPEGEYASLREKFPFVIIGRDVPLEVETAEFMAEWTLKENVSVVIDTSMMKDDKEYVEKFLEHFFHLETTARRPYLIVIEEAEDYAAEKGAPGVFLEITAVLARKGGKRGIGVIFVGHRPAWISKGILSQCPNKAIGKIESTDFKALEEFARIPRSIVEILPTLKKGEFCLAGDWVTEPTFVKVGPVETTHLGASPETVPSSPKELQTVIEGLKIKLPQIISQAKAAITPISEIKAKLESEFKAKYESKIETIIKTADEKAERKFKVKIEELQAQVEKLSRAQGLQPTSPIVDPLEHPIVQTRMLQLDDKGRDLLKFIEQNPGRTREELAARMITSKDSVANIISKINETFQLKVIVDDGGRPLRYKSMLKRLFLEDVARKEIDELKKAQEQRAAFEEELKTLRPIAQQSAALHTEVQRLTTENTSLKNVVTATAKRVDTLEKENAAFQKLKEAFAQIGEGIAAKVIDEKKVQLIVDQRIAETEQKMDDKLHRIEELAQQTPSARANNEAITVIEAVPTIQHQVERPIVTTDESSYEGRILTLIIHGFFNEKRRNSAIAKKISQDYVIQINTGNLSDALNGLVQKKILQREESKQGGWEYWLAEGAKDRIKEV